MEQNLYWYSYKNLEEEIIDLSNYIYFDDSDDSQNLDTYSIKISDLIMRCVSEIESISKDLYYVSSGVACNEDNNRKTYFDSVCMKYFADNWGIDKRRVDVISPRFKLTKDENKKLFPLKNAHKQKDGAALWNQAYQGIKHHRSRDMRKATVKNLLNGMAALYLLNIYYRDNNIKHNNHVNTLSVQPSWWFISEFCKKMDSLLFFVPVYSEVPPLDQNAILGNKIEESSYVGNFTDSGYREYFAEMKQIVESLPESVEYKNNGQAIEYGRDPLMLIRSIGAWDLNEKRLQSRRENITA